MKIEIQYNPYVLIKTDKSFFIHLTKTNTLLLLSPDKIKWLEVDLDYNFKHILGKSVATYYGLDQIDISRRLNKTS